jgi:hypothetical protein
MGGRYLRWTFAHRNAGCRPVMAWIGAGVIGCVERSSGNVLLTIAESVQ